MSEQMRLEGLGSGTSLVGLVDGPLPAGLPDGRMTGKSSPRRARASRSAKRGKAADLVIQGTYGPTHFPSSVISAPKSAWENRLMDLMATGGSTERELIWKELDTPSEQSYFQLAVSTPRRVGIGGGGLPAEPSADAKLWSGCQAHDAAPSDPARWRKNGTEHGAANLNDETAAVVEGRLWSGLQARDGDARGSQAKRFLNPERSNDLPDEVAAVAEPWPIVSARDWKSDSSVKSGEELYGAKGRPLARTALEVAQGEHWPGVRANRRGNPDSHGVPDGSLGQTGISEPAPSKPGESRKSPGGSLHPAFAGWLQGYSQAHLNCALSSSPKAGRTARRKSKGTATR